MQSTPTLSSLAAALAALEAEILNRSAETLAGWAPRLRDPAFAPSAENLAHYLALRRTDRTALQKRLRAAGLSSLGRSEGRVLGTLRAVRATVEGRDPDPEILAGGDAAAERLELAAQRLLGPRPPDRRTRIMVTLSPETAFDPARMAALVAAGIDCARINCAHDGPEAWRAMAEAARAAAAEAGRGLRIYVDLGGPKIRTTDIAPKPGRRVASGDTLFLRLDPRAPIPEEARAAFACTLPKAAAQARAGGAVAIDDGKIVGTVEARSAAGLSIRVTRTKPGGARLKPDKGINFPGSAIEVDPLTDADRTALDAIGAEADVIGYSFVQRPDDIDTLWAALSDRGLAPGVVAKIETETAFRNLPEIIVAGAGRGRFGVMIARGDLAVEIGFARLSEVQEEILWLCEAAQVPVVWATEVLAQLVKSGVAARGEFTDAAMGVRAECVMLNKGPFLEEGVAVLADVLRRAERHIDKKTPQLPRLRSWDASVDERETRPPGAAL
jgi:pyruvate kinase